MAGPCILQIWLVTGSSIQQEENGLKFKEGTSEMLHLEHGVVWCWNLDTSESKPEMPLKFLNVPIEKISWTILWKI